MAEHPPQACHIPYSPLIAENKIVTGFVVPISRIEFSEWNLTSDPSHLDGGALGDEVVGHLEDGVRGARGGERLVGQLDPLVVLEGRAEGRVLAQLVRGVDAAADVLKWRSCPVSRSQR